MAGLSCQSSCNKAVIAGTAAKIKNTVTRPDVSMINRDPAPEAQVSIRKISVEVFITLVERSHAF